MQNTKVTISGIDTILIGLWVSCIMWMLWGAAGRVSDAIDRNTAACVAR